jgi:hypothetical protein
MVMPSKGKGGEWFMMMLSSWGTTVDKTDQRFFIAKAACFGDDRQAGAGAAYKFAAHQARHRLVVQEQAGGPDVAQDGLGSVAPAKKQAIRVPCARQLGANRG